MHFQESVRQKGGMLLFCLSGRAESGSAKRQTKTGFIHRIV